MSKIKIVCDASIDLPASFIEKEDIEILYFTITIDGKSYQDGVNITTKELYKIIDKCGNLPKTSAVSPQEFINTWEKFYREYDDVIFIGLGSGFSSSLNTGILSTEEYPNVHVIDSKNLSSGTGLLVYKICKMRSEGMEASDIVSEIEKLVPNVRTQFALNTLQYMYMGGRCSGVSAFASSILKIKPIIKVSNNSMIVAKKPIGFNRALDAMLEDVISHKDEIDSDHIMVTHSMADEDAKYLISKLSEVFDKSIITESCASGTISTHCGPRTIGILYISK